LSFVAGRRTQCNVNARERLTGYGIESNASYCGLLRRRQSAEYRDQDSG
jgi:hypothetical protein